MDISISEFGETNTCETVKLIRLQRGSYELELLDYGATIRSLRVPNAQGGRTDVVLGYDTMAEYQKNDGYLGACIGRCANRIACGKFELNEKQYQLVCNDGENHLHGGEKGFDKYIWNFETTEHGARFFRVSAHGEEGYPGRLEVAVTYLLLENGIGIIYEASSGQDTVCNLTNHSYFNLNGNGSVLAHTLSLAADSFTENDAHCLPTGEILPVDGTAFDFREGKPIGQDIHMPHSQLQNCGGYDHNFVLDHASTQLHEIAKLYADRTGIVMTVRTNQPGVQVYTGNFLTSRTAKNGGSYEKHAGVCLETQFFPNAMACEFFKKPILSANERYYHQTQYTFSLQSRRAP